MFGSYGSYSSMGASVWEPINIASSSASLDDINSCAFPSWPRRDSLSASERHIPSSFLSDDDLFLETVDDARSESSFGSSAASSPCDFTSMSPRDRFLECERERQAMFAEEQAQRERQAQQNREMKKMLLAEKERRKAAAAKKARRNKKNAKLSAISE
ncbi:hypothetical protein TD95_002215 [Thielaviopsis punctulata]|uniref:Uncharacterized protein n=1 Tax=Thielaviopsis punctulata TaxID=72032 RepID=A0A0F4ZI27_9PEZI|nr:hypothetical protein TD95_002215 [Thielaviopsis punctulata]